MKHSTFQRIRDRHGLTNQSIAHEVGASESMISKIMSGDRKRGPVRDRVKNYLSRIANFRIVTKGE